MKKLLFILMAMVFLFSILIADTTDSPRFWEDDPQKYDLFVFDDYDGEWDNVDEIVVSTLNLKEELLSDTEDFSGATWSVVTKFAKSTTTFTYINATPDDDGTLTQVYTAYEGTLANNTWYLFRYTLSIVTTPVSGDGAFSITLTLGDNSINIDFGIAQTYYYLIQSDASASTDNFVITVTDSDAGDVVGTMVSLREIGDCYSVMKDLLISNDLKVKEDLYVYDEFFIYDTNESNTLNIEWNENDTANRVFNLKVNSGDRTLDLFESLVIGNGHDGTLTFSAASKTVTVEDNVTIGLDINALEALSSTGILARTAANTYAQRTITGDTNEITVTNGDGVSGNPSLSIDLNKDLVTTAPITGGVDDILVGADSDVTIAITVLKDIVAGTGLSGGENDVLPGADADVTLTLEKLGDVTVSGTGMSGGGADVVAGDDSFDFSITLATSKDIVTTSPLAGGEDNVLPGADADLTISIANDGIGDVQLEYNTGQHLTTTSDVQFDSLYVTEITAPEVTANTNQRTLSDGSVWTIRESASDCEWYSVTYGNGLFVAVAYGYCGGVCVMTSPDGINWTGRTTPESNEWSDITYGNGLFVAVATSGTNNRVMTSPDGITWTIGITPADNKWYGVTYGNGLFVAVAYDGANNRAMTSPDGITWTIQTTAAADKGWRAVTYGNGLFVAVATMGTGERIMTSPDGEVWTSQTSPVDNNWHDVVYRNGLFVAVATTGTNNGVMTSPDGLTWTSQIPAEDNRWSGITYGNGLFVAVAYDGDGNRVMTSPDGENWTIQASAANEYWYGVTYGNGLFVAVATMGTAGYRVMTSGFQEMQVPNVTTNLSIGTITGSTMVVASSDGIDATLIAATTDDAGLLTADLFDEIDVNTGKDTNVSTNLSEGTSTETTVDVNSSDGNNATLVSASTTRAGLLTKAKWDEIVANTEKVTDNDTVEGEFIQTPVGDDSIADSGTIDVTGHSYLRVVGADADATDVSLEDGTVDGQRLLLQGTADGNLVTLTDGNNCELEGDVNMSLGQGDTIELVWDAGDSNWYEITRSGN